VSDRKKGIKLSEIISYIILRGKLHTVTPLYLDSEGGEEKPFIPAYLMKSKLRLLLELSYGMKNRGAFHRCKKKDCFLCLLFGCGNPDAGPARLFTRDSTLLKLPEKNLLIEKERFPWDIKFEWNRIIYRVPPGTVFTLELIYRVFDQNNDRGSVDYGNFKYIPEALSLLEDDYLGRGGSRGGGKVILSDLDMDIKISLGTPSLPEGWKFEREEGRGTGKLVRI